VINILCIFNFENSGGFELIRCGIWCLGVFLGFIAGYMIGGPWVIILPLIGLILGLLIDIKIERHIHNELSEND